MEVPEPAGTAQLELACAGCGERLAVSVFLEGAETLFQPQLLGDEAEAAGRQPDPEATVALGTGTAVLSSGSPEETTHEVETVLQAALILAGAEPGSERFILTAARTSVGREDADIVVDDPALSGRHFEIEIRGREYFVRDLDSSNGTMLNGARIRAAELASGDTLVAGRSRFTFRTFEAISV